MIYHKLREPWRNLRKIKQLKVQAVKRVILKDKFPKNKKVYKICQKFKSSTKNKKTLNPYLERENLWLSN